MLRGVDVGRFGRAIRALRGGGAGARSTWRARRACPRTQVGRIERGERRRLPADTFDRGRPGARGVARPRASVAGRGPRSTARRGSRPPGRAGRPEAQVARMGRRCRSVVLAVRRARLDRRPRIPSGAPGAARHRGEVGHAGHAGDARRARPKGQARRRDRPRPRMGSGGDVARSLSSADTRTNRRRIEAHAAACRAALPARTRDVLRWLRDPTGSRRERGLVPVRSAPDGDARRSDVSGSPQADRAAHRRTPPTPSDNRPAPLRHDPADEQPPGASLARDDRSRAATPSVPTAQLSRQERRQRRPVAIWRQPRRAATERDRRGGRRERARTGPFTTLGTTVTLR